MIDKLPQDVLVTIFGYLTFGQLAKAWVMNKSLYTASKKYLLSIIRKDIPNIKLYDCNFPLTTYVKLIHNKPLAQNFNNILDIMSMLSRGMDVCFYDKRSLQMANGTKFTLYLKRIEYLGAIPRFIFYNQDYGLIYGSNQAEVKFVEYASNSKSVIRHDKSHRNSSKFIVSNLYPEIDINTIRTFLKIVKVQLPLGSFNDTECLPLTDFNPKPINNTDQNRKRKPDFVDQKVAKQKHTKRQHELSMKIKKSELQTIVSVNN
jgi:hypothetical protein